MRTTVSLDDEQTAYVDDVRESADDSDAQAIRDAINRASELEDRVEELDQENEQLRREKQTLLDRREQLERIEQRMATSDEIETYHNNGAISWIRNKLF